MLIGLCCVAQSYQSSKLDQTLHIRMIKFRDIPKNIKKNCWMAYLSSSLLCLVLVPILQSIITSSGSSLSTRWRGFSHLSPSTSPEQKRRVATSPSRCEYSTASHQAYFTSHLCRCTRSLTHAICSWAFNSIKKENKLGRPADTHGNNSRCCMKENYKWR